MSDADKVLAAREFVSQFAKHVTSPEVRTDGRRCAIAALDVLLSDPHNLQKFYKALQRDFDKDPLVFYQKYGMPLSGRATNEVDHEGDTDSNIAGGNTIILQIPDNHRTIPCDIINDDETVTAIICQE